LKFEEISTFWESRKAMTQSVNYFSIARNNHILSDVVDCQIIISEAHGYTFSTYVLKEGEDKSLTTLAFVNGIHIHTESKQQVRLIKGGMKINMMAYNLYNKPWSQTQSAFLIHKTWDKIPPKQCQIHKHTEW
jgi:hypothetical protein